MTSASVMRAIQLSTALFAVVFAAACGGGVPTQITIDEFTLDVELDDAMDGAHEQLIAQGLLGDSTPALPEIWPDNLPDIQYRTLYAATPVPIDLTPEPDDGADPAAPITEGESTVEDDKYADINQALELIERIEINRFILRVEDTTLSVNLPELRLQIADDPEADPTDRLAWYTVGLLPGTTTPGQPEDVELQWIPGGESFLNAQLGDEDKAFAMRVVGNINLDTAEQPRIPSGKAVMRLIIVATFFIKPESAL